MKEEDSEGEGAHLKAGRLGLGSWEPEELDGVVEGLEFVKQGMEDSGGMHDVAGGSTHVPLGGGQ